MKSKALSSATDLTHPKCLDTLVACCRRAFSCRVISVNSIFGDVSILSTTRQTSSCPRCCSSLMDRGGERRCQSCCCTRVVSGVVDRRTQMSFLVIVRTRALHLTRVSYKFADTCLAFDTCLLQSFWDACLTFEMWPGKTWNK
jgi:hypothetical protein